jgi:hypothetical protein
MIGRLALRSLTSHPVRSAVLAAGFGVGVAVMAILLGVAAIVLEQAQSPALVGGGDVLIRLNQSVPARMVLAGTLQSAALRPRVKTASPFQTTSLFLLHEGRVSRVDARGGIPSLERSLGDPETSQVATWRDTPADVAWTSDSPGRVLRQIDRFHEIPDVPRWSNSWAEWLYFNGRTRDARFYLTFMVGSRTTAGRRSAGVRLQLERNGRMESFTGGTEITEADALRAPDLTIGSNQVRLQELTYHVTLDLADARGRRARGTLMLTASPGKLVPPIEISGANGWRTGYVVPVMAGALDGSLDVDGATVSLQNGTGYHDHNWGFWEGVSWQWGQAQNVSAAGSGLSDLSLLYGRVFAPPEAADPERIPGFVGVLGPDGPLGYATDVRIVEQNDPSGRPTTISITGRGPSLNVTARFDVASAVTTPGFGKPPADRRSPQGPIGDQLDFLQLRGQYTVVGTAGNRKIDFTAPGAAETFRGR